MRTVFLRVLDSEDKAAALRLAIREAKTRRFTRFEVETRGFAAVPRSPFAYWVSGSLRRLFVELPPLEADGRVAQRALATNNDLRFLRLSWERLADRAASRPASGWLPFAKGGSFSPYYADVHLLVNWLDEGVEIEADALQKFPYLRGNAEWVLHRECNYLRPGLTWPLRTQGGFSLRAMPAGCIFGHKGPAAFVANDNSEDLLALLAIGNGRAFRALIDLQMAFGSYEVGVIQRTPVPRLSPADTAALATLARRAWSLKRSLETRTETSHDFVLPALLQVEGETLAAQAAAWGAQERAIEVELTAIRGAIDDRCFELYGINNEDRWAITEGFGGSEASEEEAEGVGDADLEEEAEDDAAPETATLTAELVSWAVGVAFGRFDVCLATGTRTLPGEPEPFDPLPVCSPAMLTGADSLPFASPPTGYPFAFPEDGILVDDPGHPLDITTTVRAVFDMVFGPTADVVWQEAAALLDPRDHELRNWLASSFFEHHLRHHSKSRRKAPILWQLGVPSGRYSTWLYAHRLTPDSLFALARDIVAPKLALEESRRAGLVQDAGANPTAKQRADIAAQDAIVEEIHAFADEVRRVARLWDPDLDDGIVLAMAPLWRLVPCHRVWQKELKSRWDELVAGKHDWAHLAMQLFPERVVPKCATDRSLAIAHGLEDVFWVEGAEGKWTRRTAPTRSIDDLVAVRTSPAVKAALVDLLAVTASNGSGGRRARTRG